MRSAHRVTSTTPNRPHVRQRGRGFTAAICVVTVVAVSTACRSTSSTATTTPTANEADGSSKADGSADTVPGGTTLKLFVHSSLKKQMASLTAAYKKVTPKVTLDPVFLTTTEIEKRLAAGEKPDLIIESFSRIGKFASSRSADSKDLTIGTDVLQIAVAKGNPKGVTSVSSFGADPATVSGLCVEAEPCGRVARDLLKEANVTPAPDREEDEPQKLMDGIAGGSIDVALLFRTDLTAAGEGKLVGIPAVPAVKPTTYQAMIVKPGEPVTKFLQWVKTGPEAEKALTATGLRPLDVEKPTAS